jgi:tetratricopeptide (TPR) repeat protein
MLALAVLVAPASGAESERDGIWGEQDLVRAALIAGGTVDECELAGWLDRYEGMREELVARQPSGSAVARLASLHEGLHQRVLTGEYGTAASDVRLTLSRGEYNCLSALALFADLCSSARLPVEIWLTRGHVFVRATIEGDVIEIEPASREWSFKTAARRRGERKISPVELLGKFYYNRGIELLKEQRFAEGIELLERALRLDPADQDARANLVAGLNNWAVDQLQSKRYEAAAALIQQGLAIDPQFAPLVANQQVLQARRVGEGVGSRE